MGPWRGLGTFWRPQRYRGRSEPPPLGRSRTSPGTGSPDSFGGPARTRVGVWLIGHVISPLQRQLYRRSGGRISLTGSAPVLLLTTIGRRTGKPRTVPVFYLRDGKRFIVCNVNPGFEQPNPWTLNLRANASAHVQVGAVTIEVRARAATDEEVARYWPELVGLWSAYEAFYERGGSRSVFILEPDGHDAAGRSV